MPSLAGSVAQLRDSFARVSRVFETEGYTAGSRLVAEIRGHVARVETAMRVLGKPVSPDLEFIWRARLLGAEKAERQIGTRVFNAELRRSNDELNQARKAMGLSAEPALQVTEPARVLNLHTGKSRIA